MKCLVCPYEFKKTDRGIRLTAVSMDEGMHIISTKGYICVPCYISKVRDVDMSKRKVRR